MQRWLPDHLLLRGDRTGIAASVEARVPLLDPHLVDYASSLRALFDWGSGIPAAREELMPGELGPRG